MNFRLFPEQKLSSKSHTTGILPSQILRKFIKAKYLKSEEEIEEEQIQPASVDLRLSKQIYELKTSFLPQKGEKLLKVAQKFIEKELSLEKPLLLEKKKVYLAKLKESLNLPSEFWGKVNPKSTTGRLDIFARALVDGTEEFNFIPPGFKGEIYLEISPQSFNLILQEGDRLAQLRLIRGNPPSPDSLLHQLHNLQMLLYQEELEPQDPKIKQGLLISINLKPSNNSKVIGFVSKETQEPIEFKKVAYYPIERFWEKIETQEELILQPQRFYLLGSKEKIRVPPKFAAEMFPYEPQIGEFRVHYAGFFDPGFGFGKKGEIKGARAVLEIRPHTVPFLIRDGQVVGKLKYERLIEEPDKVYNLEIGSYYQGQELKLAKQFKNEF